MNSYPGDCPFQSRPAREQRRVGYWCVATAAGSAPAPSTRRPRRGWLHYGKEAPIGSVGSISKHSIAYRDLDFTTRMAIGLTGPVRRRDSPPSRSTTGRPMCAALQRTAGRGASQLIGSRSGFEDRDRDLTRTRRALARETDARSRGGSRMLPDREAWPLDGVEDQLERCGRAGSRSAITRAQVRAPRLLCCYAAVAFAISLRDRYLPQKLRVPG